jgi:hypothetical protein
VIIIKVTNYWKVEAVQPVTYGGNDNGLPNPCPYFVEFVHERLGHRIQMPLDASTRQTVSAYLALLEMFEDGLLDNLRQRPPLGGGKATEIGV